MEEDLDIFDENRRIQMDKYIGKLVGNTGNPNNLKIVRK